MCIMCISLSMCIYIYIYTYNAIYIYIYIYIYIWLANGVGQTGFQQNAHKSAIRCINIY